MTKVITQFHAYLLTEKRVSANTFSAYKRDIAQFEQYLKKTNIAFETLSITHIKEFLRYLKEELKLNARSISRKIAALKLFFTYLHEFQHHPNEYIHDLVLPKTDKKLPAYLSEQELRALLHATEQDKSELGVRNALIIYLLYATGMRISELTMLKIPHIHFDTGLLDVCGKGGKMRMIPMPPSIVEQLKQYLQQVHVLFTKNGLRPTDYLFPILYGNTIRPITRQAVWGIVKQLCKKAGISHSISPHQLRHSLATHMLKEGADLRSLQLLLGHENIATVQIYTHVETSHLRTVYDKKHPRS